MERTTRPGEKRSLGSRRIQVLSELTNRAILAAKLGIQFGGDRDLYEALGYKTIVEFDDFYARYVRQEIAKAIIDRPVKATWQGPLELIESNEAEDTKFEKAWKDLDRKLGLKVLLSRVDRLTGIGRYGIILLGLNDVRDAEGFLKPVNGGSYKLIYAKPFGERTAKIDSFEANPQNERYGKPLIYQIQVIDAATKKNQIVRVHHSRVIHITDDNLESEVYGTPRLEAVYNRLMDIEKIAGGDAEMFWRGARPGYHGKVDPEYTMTEDAKEDLQDQLDEYEHKLRRFLINEGVDIEALTQEIADPSTHIDTQLKLVSAETGIPLRVLTGSERGELASSQDTTEWLTYVQERREDHAEPRIVRPTVDRLIELGILPKPAEDYTVKWKDLFSISEKAMVEIGKGRANALREYTYNPIAQGIIPPKVFMYKFLGFDTETVTLVEKMQKEEMGEELMDLIKEAIKKEAEPAPVAAPGQTTQPKRTRTAT